MTQRIDELDTDKLKTKIKGTAGRLKDTGIAKLGNKLGIRTPKAHGKLAARIGADELLNAWKTYQATQNKGGNPIEGNADDLRQYIGRYYGNDALQAVEPVLSGSGGQTPPTQNPPPSNGPGPTPPTGSTPSPQAGTAPSVQNVNGTMQTDANGWPTGAESWADTSQADPNQPPPGSTPEQVKAFHEQKKAEAENQLRQVNQDLVKHINGPHPKGKGPDNDIISKYEQEQERLRSVIAKHQAAIGNPQAAPAQAPAAPVQAAKPVAAPTRAAQAPQKPQRPVNPFDDGVTIPAVPSPQQAPQQSNTPTQPDVPAFLRRQQNNVPDPRTFGQKGRTPFDTPQPEAPPVRAFGRKGTDNTYVPPADRDNNVIQGGFGRKAAPASTAAAARRQEPRVSTGQDDKLVSRITDALSKAPSGSDAREKLVANIRKMQANPNIVQKYPEIAQIKANESARRSGRLIEAALSYSELDKVFLRLAAWVSTSGFNKGANSPSGAAGPSGTASGVSANGVRPAAKPAGGGHHHVNPTQLLQSRITEHGLDDAIRNASSVRGFVAPDQNDISAIKNVLGQNPNGMTLQQLLVNSRLNHINPRSLVAIFFAMERSH